MNAHRLSDKQLFFLQCVIASETPSDRFEHGLPLYVHGRFMEFEFNTEGEKLRWIKKLIERGLVTAGGPMNCFVRITKSGRAAVGAAISRKWLADKGATA